MRTPPKATFGTDAHPHQKPLLVPMRTLTKSHFWHSISWGFVFRGIPLKVTFGSNAHPHRKLFLAPPPAPPRQKQKKLLLHTCYGKFRSRLLFCFYVFFFIAIAYMFVCIDINIATVIFSTYFNTTWTIT